MENQRHAQAARTKDEASGFRGFSFLGFRVFGV